MPVVSIGPNLIALKTANQLNKTQDKLATSYTRLSSGLRINKPSDDAAGLSVSAKLNSDTRVYGQALRNINDGVSLLATAEGATQELSSILSRLKELATQSASGVLSTSQRVAIDTEGAALTNEYNRIVGSVEFNKQKMLNGSYGNLTVQTGYGAQGYLSFGVGAEADRTVGDGTFLANVSYSSGSNNYDVATADVNGDGILDIVTSSYSDGRANVFIGNGNGTFQARTSFVASANSTNVSVALADVNSDGFLDIITSSIGAEDKVNILLGNGNGTFQARVSYVVGNDPYDVSVGDLNNDGVLDLVTSNVNGDSASVLLGNGDGTFKVSTSYASSSSAALPYTLTLGDVNGDGKLDIVSVLNNAAPNSFSVMLGNGDGSFGARTTYATDSSPYTIMLADFNFDGILDVAVTAYTVSKIDIFLGNGNGSFKAAVSYATDSNPQGLVIADMNGDGFSDLVTSAFGSTKVNVLLGNGDGTFQAKVSFATATTQQLTVGDFNRDGAPDIVTSSGASDIRILLANGTQTTTMPRLNLTTQSDAREALGTINQMSDRIYLELASLGSSQKRLEVNLNRIGQLRTELSAANSRITDVDVAQEVGRMVKNQILSQAQTALLAQANQTPSIVLGLLT